MWLWHLNGQTWTDRVGLSGGYECQLSIALTRWETYHPLIYQFFTEINRKGEGAEIWAAKYSEGFPPCSVTEGRRSSPVKSSHILRSQPVSHQLYKRVLSGSVFSSFQDILNLIRRKSEPLLLSAAGTMAPSTTAWQIKALSRPYYCTAHPLPRTWGPGHTKSAQIRTVVRVAATEDE